MLSSTSSTATGGSSAAAVAAAAMMPPQAQLSFKPSLHHPLGGGDHYSTVLGPPGNLQFLGGGNGAGGDNGGSATGGSGAGVAPGGGDVSGGAAGLIYPDSTRHRGTYCDTMHLPAMDDGSMLQKSSNSKQQLISPEEKPKPEATRESLCFGDSSVGIAAAAAAASDSGRGGALDRKLQAATTAVYGASLHFGKELLIRVTSTQNAAGATGLAVVEVRPPCAAQEAREQVLATATGTAVGVHWDTAEATYASDS
ncbi:hypothetical protein OsI_06271 [Oryza sativa Indica Group]|uniref:Uncharacterized protein n=1 Tax=Oryza sativa subsp. indica TaxID=39946 RepID=B8ADT6_ORYSI|nr:hypothetical protein OsI_06271 [Oryza sativa Indica Group]